MQTTEFDLKKLNQRYENAHPRDILAWAVHTIPTGLVQASAFNVDDLLITDLLYRELRPTRDVPVLFLDTLHHFKETLDLVAKATSWYGLNLKVYKIQTVKTRKEFAARYGDALWDHDLEQFLALTKMEPLQRGLHELDTAAWITGRRRDQADIYRHLPVFEQDRQGRLKINPLANWTRKETWAYVFEHDVIYNPLHDQGYPCIGDEPMTVGGDRNGHWRGLLEQTECSIYL